MLGGQKAPYKLLVRAVSQETGLEVPHITFVASEDFVVLSSPAQHITPNLHPDTRLSTAVNFPPSTQQT